jgi:hypothetical protein
MSSAVPESVRRRPVPQPRPSNSDASDDAAAVPRDAIAFVYSPFKYNSRFWLVFAPCLVVLLNFGGTMCIGALTIGGLIGYTFDAVQSREGAFVTLWVTVFAMVLLIANAAIPLLRISIFNAALTYLLCIVLLEVGVWGTLQFRFMQQQYPRLVLVLERMLFAVFPITASIILTWASIAWLGIELAAYYFCAVLSLNYYLFYLPLPSSFRAAGDPDVTIIGRPEATIACLLLVIGPSFLHRHASRVRARPAPQRAHSRHTLPAALHLARCTQRHPPQRAAAGARARRRPRMPHCGAARRARRAGPSRLARVARPPQRAVAESGADAARHADRAGARGLCGDPHHLPLVRGVHPPARAVELRAGERVRVLGRGLHAAALQRLAARVHQVRAWLCVRVRVRVCACMCVCLRA